VIAAVLVVGVEVLALGVFGVKAWAGVYLTPPSADAMPIQFKPGNLLSISVTPGPDGKFGPLHPERINEGSQEFSASTRNTMLSRETTSSPPRWPSR